MTSRRFYSSIYYLVNSVNHPHPLVYYTTVLCYPTVENFLNICAYIKYN